MKNADVLCNLLRVASTSVSVKHRIMYTCQKILMSLDVSESTARSEVNGFLDATRKYHENLYGLEYSFHQKLAKLHVYDHLPKQMKLRAETTMKHLVPGNSRDATTIDIGGGSGHIANEFSRLGNPITIADVINWNEFPEIPFVQVEQDCNIDVSSESYDNALLLTVLHHADDPDSLIREAFRVAREITIIESVTNDLHGYLYGGWIDWFYNRCLFYTHEDEGEKINVPCNFLPSEAWKQRIFKLTGRMPIGEQDLGIYQSLNPEHHYLLRY